ncbi:MAG: MBL fold metallo-hydrolase [Verrucomicrobia bacterium]|nr:MBL fold metallo-hydrolase [Verrucomicrobiota bacterium]
MRFTNLTKEIEIGANSYHIQLDGAELVLDAGLHPRNEGEAALPNYRFIPDHELDAILITHAHQDHIGSLPVLMRRQPQAPVYMTGPTAALSEAMLHNSVNVMSRQREELGLGVYPLFTHRETDLFAQAWQSVGLRQRWNLQGERVTGDNGELTFEMYHAGHILGSAGVMLRSQGRKIFYTGDVNFADQTLMRKAEFPEEPLDVLIVETTRGDRALPPAFNRPAEEERFLQAILEAFERGGSVLVPVFALGKTQEVLTMLFEFRNRGLLKRTPIYIGGLSTKITVIHDQLASVATRQHVGVQLLDTLAPYVLSGREVGTTQLERQHIYALSSGMMSEKTLSNQLAARILSDPKQSIFFVGYADPESPGGRLKAGQPEEPIRLDNELPEQPLICRVEEFDFSAHSPREQILNYICQTRPQTVVLVHGGPASMSWFEAAIAEALPGTRVVIPVPGETYEL